ncbi:MAG: long-chain fatty acid--CoA ligase [Bacteroidetes bacterium]|nr:MAG: long-chain fatty acid--CoA ligase [Bacteroidota bacterium]
MEIELPYPSLHHMMRNAASKIKTPHHNYMYEKVGNEYKAITYAETFEKLNAISAYLYDLGLRKGDRAALILENCPEFIFFDQGLQQIGAVNASIYPTLSEGEIEYILNDSGSRVVLVGSPFLLKKVLKVRSLCPALQKIIINYTDSKAVEDEGIIELEKVYEIGKSLYGKYHAAIEEELAKATPGDLAMLIYTSGTTGVPKGVMLSHGNIMSNIVMALILCKAISSADRFLSFLPLSHVYERMVTYYLGSCVATEMAFAVSVDTIATNVKEIKPSIIATVPRLLERIEEKVRKKAAGKGKLKNSIFLWALKVGQKARLRREEGKGLTPVLALQHFIADKLVFSDIKANLGGNIRMIISGGGPLPQHVGEFFGNIGIRVMEGYGLTETSPFVCVNEFERQVFGTVGRIAPGNTVCLKNPDTGVIITEQTYESQDFDFESEEGEICIKGPNVMMGYWNKPEDTSKVIDADGWFHTGDIGKFYKGNLKITDRIKNMIVNAYGKNIYPAPVENVYLRSNKIEQIFLIGDKREHLTAIVIPSKEELMEQFKIASDFFETGEAFIQDEKIVKWIDEDIKALSNQLAKFERIKGFIVKRKPFSIDEGELTPTQKAKRRVIETKYANDIDRLYAHVKE